jgi:uncharacterized protein related to proFAR isomerase
LPPTPAIHWPRRAYSSGPGLDELYVADLDAIGGDGGEHGALNRRAGARRARDGRRRCEAIVLNLARMGSGAGPDVALIAEINVAFPASSGAAGALVATALHNGVIGSAELAELR